MERNPVVKRRGGDQRTLFLLYERFWILLTAESNFCIGNYNRTGRCPVKTVFLLLTPTLVNLDLYWSTYLSGWCLALVNTFSCNSSVQHLLPGI